MNQLNKNKTVCFFGIFDPEYSRNRVLIRGFKDNGYNVTQCRVDPKQHKNIKKFFVLYKKFLLLPKKNFDYVVVAFPGHSVVWLARLLFGGRIIFDVFVSLYNSEVEDRRLKMKISLKAFYYWFLDWYSMHFSKKIIIDTVSHRNFLSKKFFVSKKKFIVVPVGSDDNIVYPIKKETVGRDLIVHFHGTGVPLQGVDYIVEAAHILEKNSKIKFHIYGVKGIETTNIKFFPRFPYSNISKVLSESDIVLGIFGNTEKSKNVIPNKVYEGLATKKAVITEKSPAIVEFLTDKVNVLLCKGGDPEDLASNICMLAQNDFLRENLAKKGFRLFKERFTPEIIVKKDLIKHI